MDTIIKQEPNHEEEIDVLSCTVRSVIFCNEENGYAVLSVTDTDGTEQKMTGTFPYAWPGETITAYGHWGMHGTYGRQFEAESSERSTPEDERSVFSYLASGAVKGIGPVMAGQIVERFGKSALRVLEEEPGRLAEIRGISLNKAEKIAKEFRRQVGLKKLVLLRSWGLRMQIPTGFAPVLPSFSGITNTTATVLFPGQSSAPPLRNSCSWNRKISPP